MAAKMTSPPAFAARESAHGLSSKGKDWRQPERRQPKSYSLSCARRRRRRRSDFCRRISESRSTSARAIASAFSRSVWRLTGAEASPLAFMRLDRRELIADLLLRARELCVSERWSAQSKDAFQLSINYSASSCCTRRELGRPLVRDAVIRTQIIWRLTISFSAATRSNNSSVFRMRY